MPSIQIKMFHIFPTNTQSSYKIPSWYFDNISTTHDTLPLKPSPPQTDMTFRTLIEETSSPGLVHHSEANFNTSLPDILNGSKAMLSASNSLKRLLSLEKVSPSASKIRYQTLPSRALNRVLPPIRDSDCARKSWSMFDFETQPL